MRADTLEQARIAYAHDRWEDAYRGFRAATEHADLDVDDLAAMADAAWWIGHTDESLTLSEEVYRRHLRDERIAPAARVAIELGSLWFLRGEPTVGSGWVSRASRLLAAVPPCAEHGYLLLLEVEESMGRGDLDHAIELTRRVLQLADAHHDDTLCAVGLVFEGTAIAKQGRVDAGLAVLDDAMLSVRAGVVAPSWAGYLYCHVMGLCFELADIPRARAWTDATERWCDQHSNAAMFLGICRVHRAQLLHLEGAWPDAERHATQACQDLTGMNLEAVAAGQYQLAELHRLRGDHARAEEAYARAHELGRDPQPGLALLRLAQGDSEVADVAIRTALAGEEQPLARAPLLAARIDVAEARADAVSARAVAHELAEIAGTFGTPGLVAASRQAAGTARSLAGEPARALPLLRDACRRWRAQGARYEAARVRIRLGRALDAVGDMEAAAREFGAARTVLTMLGAVDELRLLTGPAPRAAHAGGLTSRETEVLACVAAGRTNRQIATELSISERTVERHLSNIFLKLDVSSRTAAAGFAFAHGLADPTRR